MAATVAFSYSHIVMSVTIPDGVLESARMSEPEEIAVLLFQKEKLTLAQASRLAQMDRLRFSTSWPAARSRSTMTWPISK